MGKLLIAAACLLLIQAASESQEPAADPIAAKITAAKDAYYAERDKAEQALIEALKRKEDAAKKLGDLNALEAIRAEIEAFTKQGTLPKLVPLTNYNTTLKIARTKLENNFAAMIKSLTQADKIDEAKELQAQLLNFQKNGTFFTGKTADPTPVAAPERPPATVPSPATIPSPATMPTTKKSIVPAPVEKSGPRKLRIVMLNLRYTTDPEVLGLAAQAVMALEPDLVALHCLASNTVQIGKVDQALEMGKLTKMPHAIFVKNFPFSGGSQGNGFLSRWPISSVKSTRLPNAKGVRYHNVDAATIELPDKRQLLFCTVEIDNRGDQQAKFDMIRDWFEAMPQPLPPTILAGQLNHKPDSEWVTGMSPAWTRAKGEQDLEKQRDYMMFRPAKSFEVLKPEAIAENDIPEYKPVWCELELK